jgi:hypothetical protein
VISWFQSFAFDFNLYRYTAIADQTRIVIVYSKFFFGPHLDIALANNTVGQYKVESS